MVHKFSVSSTVIMTREELSDFLHKHGDISGSSVSFSRIVKEEKPNGSQTTEA